MQLSFGDAEYAGKRKQTRREVFLLEMEQVVPWKSLVSLITPFYPVAGNGRRPYPLTTMLRIHLMQNWFGLGDEAMEEALYEVASMRQFASLSLTGAIPDETTILNFRHLLEEYELAADILAKINGHLSRQGLLLKRGTTVHTEPGLIGTTFIWSAAVAAAEAGALGDRITVEITAERDGLSSWQPQVRSMERTGYGLRWGQYWGGV